ncbi:MAG: hypothetical protein ACRDSN_01175, partial [Pseudonocardiaceae bacterium]
MTGPQPANPPLTGGVCASWAQLSELPDDVESLHTADAWCAILAAASDVVWSASGRRWRNKVLTETVTLDEPVVSCLPRRSAWWGHDPGPVWCDPQRPSRVRLPRLDVTAVTAVTVD